MVSQYVCYKRNWRTSTCSTKCKFYKECYTEFQKHPFKRQLLKRVEWLIG